MIKLNDRAWGSFRLSDLFEITLAKPFFLDKTFDQTDISGTPYITRSSFNNGLVNRLNLEIIDNSLKLINAGDCLTVGAEGKKAFYQNNDFIAGNKVTILRNRNISKLNYFFIIVVLDMAMKEVFSYGRAATYGRLINLNINLPSKDGDPDWQFMEDYIKQFEEIKLIEKQESNYKDNVKLPSVDKWGSFRLDELFTISRGRITKKPSDIGEVPYISSSGMNNGLNESFNIDCKYIVRADLSPVITVANNGSVGSTFVQEFSFAASSDVSVLEPIFNSNADALLFIKVVIERSKSLYGYGRKWGLEKMRTSIIKLPVLENGEPDWELMEKYIKQFEETKMIETQKYECKDSVTLPSVDEWGSFRLDELFTISLGRLAKKPSDIGEVPYISSSGMNNGLNESFDIDSKYIVRADLSPVITVANDGSVGSTFIQEFAFASSRAVSVLYPKFNMTRLNALFLTSIIKKEKFRFGYGRKWALSRMCQSVIKLPALENGEPDWEIMERYIKSLQYIEYLKIKNILK